ncbi:MAG: FAD-dependent oxidoreductase [Mesorhizobium amorphae]|nr:MAG: FAD-dependent oxidoreductase [Mesorhizobium amorphae]
MLDLAPTRTAELWLEKFGAALEARDIDAAMALFGPECFWRDMLAFTWNIMTAEGPDAVRDLLRSTLAEASPTAWAIAGEAAAEDGVVEAWFTFETKLGRCEGAVRLRGGHAHTVFTALRELKGFEERRGATRPLGVRHGADRARETWGERRARSQAALGTSEQPYVVIIGGGQGGIMLGARLKQLGVPTVILETNARAGDSWRNRYRSLVLHDPVWYDHFPYIPFPAHWPVFTPKDQMGDWMEMYARVMELDFWGSSAARHASFDEATKRWTVEVERWGEGEQRTVTLQPHHLVFATGAYGPPRMPDFAGRESFAGQVIHSSRYKGADEFAGKRVAVIGSASSAHDIAVDLWEAGVDVTMVQRSPATVVRSSTLMELGFPTYSEDAVARGIDVDRADLIGASTPMALVTEGQKKLYAVIRKRDAAFYEALAASGFLLDFGEDESGQMMKAMRTGSGYYIDVGASDLIAKGEIKVVSGAGVERLSPEGLLLSDGRTVACDAVIASTGFQSMHETVAEIVSREVADRVGPCWGLGSGVRGDPGPWQGEPRNMWKPTAQEALWFQGGNLALSRFNSRFLALQLKARLEGLPTPVYGKPSNS